MSDRFEEDARIVECCVCFNAFADAPGVRPVVRMCGHSCCETCAKRITNKCPRCQAAITPRRGAKLVVNYQLLDQIRNHEEMKRRLSDMQKTYATKEREVNTLMVKARKADTYAQALKCKECEYPMRDGFFCLTCLGRTQEQLESLSDSLLHLILAKTLCGGCTRKHEKQGHSTAELEEIKKKQKHTKFKRDVEEKSEKICNNVSSLTKRLCEVQDLLNIMSTRLEVTCGSVAAGLEYHHFGIMEEKLLDDLETLYQTSDQMAAKYYVLKQQIEGVTTSASSLLDASMIDEPSAIDEQELLNTSLDICRNESALGTPSSDEFHLANEFPDFDADEPCSSKSLKRPIKEELITPPAKRGGFSKNKRLRRAAVSSDDD